MLVHYECGQKLDQVLRRQRLDQLKSNRFGPQELKGLKLFLADRTAAPNLRRQGVGNCAICHPPPAFTDFIFHNTGASQEEYEAVHGPGTFNQLYVPGLAQRQANYEAYLPPTPNHPHATGRFESAPIRQKPGQADLGLWNVFANPEFPAPQAGLQQILPKLLGLASPHIDQAALRDRQFEFSGGGGEPNGVFYVLASPLSPSAAWVVVATNRFDLQGHFHLHLPVLPNTPQTFYKLSLRLPTPAQVLPLMLGRFKTPTLRDLGQSDPYLHTGCMDSLEAVLRFYQRFSEKARRGEVRNPDPEMRHVALADGAIAPLAAFLRSLNEDYTD